VAGMTQDAIIYARVPRELRKALERERQRMSRASGAEVKTSAVIRSILERALRKTSRRAVA
jgi:predicted NAD-dependent protein-ADP-ribosyltransferase YbiA (DUF1768 family)